MANSSQKTIHSIPVSAYQPVALERPLKLFGKTFKVHISTGLTFSPDTLLQSTLGMSLRQFLRKNNERTDTTLKDLWRGATKKNKLSETTRTLIKQRLGEFYPSDVLDDILDGREPATPLAWKSDWESLLKGMGESKDDLFHPLVERFAGLDRLAWSAWQSHKNGSPEKSMEMLETLCIGLHDEGWQQYYPNLILTVAILVDVSLQTLVWLELRSVTKHPVGCSRIPASQLLFLLASGKKPIGNWLLKMQKSAACANLQEFSVLMVSKDIKRHGYFVSHDLLKKWSSGVQLMPEKACECILKAVGGRLDVDREHGWFVIAKFLSFLCDLVIAGTRGEPPLWTTAQNQISRRHSELYEKERSRLLAS